MFDVSIKSSDKSSQANTGCGVKYVQANDSEGLFSGTMVEWYRNNSRNYAWRDNPDTYKVLISEIMLQQTNADKVLPVYEMFVHQYPSIHALAQSKLQDLEAILQSLGLRYRATRLKRIAEYVVDKYEGEVPNSIEDLLRLPGIGRYIANAVACFGWGRRVALVDVNVLRLYHRVFGFTSQKARPREDSGLWELAEKLLPEIHFKEYNLALIDFSAGVCTVKKPKCDWCPVSNMCLSYARGIQANETSREKGITRD